MHTVTRANRVDGIVVVIYRDAVCACDDLRQRGADSIARIARGETRGAEFDDQPTKWDILDALRNVHADSSSEAYLDRVILAVLLHKVRLPRLGHVQEAEERRQRNHRVLRSIQ